MQDRGRERVSEADAKAPAHAARQRSQILGILILAALVLIVGCIRYYFKLA